MAYDDAGPFPAGKDRRSSFPAPPPEAPRRPAAIAGAVAAGVAAGVLGTALHGHLLFVGGVAVPVGALAALLLAGSLFLLCGLWARNVMMTALAGAIAYGIVALLSRSSKTLILTGSSTAAPGTALAGNLWLFGVLIATLAAVVRGVVVLRQR
ncbi:hypothetical protein [Arthrobacter antioxidans]|uniref:hypothetical protein n=1 Tax=Arthrobacter antioxidans TaxID=2895818 RepID=UPI001FFFAC9B|nr:hypothetical protein [Arthrobacter antioxidans]